MIRLDGLTCPPEDLTNALLSFIRLFLVCFHLIHQENMGSLSLQDLLLQFVPKAHHELGKGCLNMLLVSLDALNYHVRSFM